VENAPDATTLLKFRRLLVAHATRTVDLIFFLRVTLLGLTDALLYSVASLVHAAIEIFPRAFDLNIGFIHAPTLAHRARVLAKTSF
jgi:hypothetical protein